METIGHFITWLTGAMSPIMQLFTICITILGVILGSGLVKSAKLTAAMKALELLRDVIAAIVRAVEQQKKIGAVKDNGQALFLAMEKAQAKYPDMPRAELETEIKAAVRQMNMERDFQNNIANASNKMIQLDSSGKFVKRLVTPEK